MVRLYELQDEAYYVVRRADGRPLAVPVWMTRPEAAHAKMVSAARRPVRVLLASSIARALGWQDIDVIDDDLGISGGGASRPGFERLLRALCDGQIGAVFSIEASRLARNGRDWHTLLEFCARSSGSQLGTMRCSAC